MALLSDSLTVWEIGFRWAGLDDKQWWLRIPVPVRDHFSNLMDAILKAELACISITLEKPSAGHPIDPEISVYTYLDDIYACIWGKRFNRKLLKWASIDRVDFHQWCERRGIPLPGFWFPPGWKLDYEMPEEELLPGHGYLKRHQLEAERLQEGDGLDLASPTAVESEATGTQSVEQKDALGNIANETIRPEGNAKGESGGKLRANQRIRIACEQIAMEIWRKEPDRTIASMVMDERVQDLGGGRHYVPETVREWISKVAPAHVRQKRGRPRKENGGEDD